MKLPRDLDGNQLAQAFSKFSYEITRQTGSRICQNPIAPIRLPPPRLADHLAGKPQVELFFFCPLLQNSVERLAVFGL